MKPKSLSTLLAFLLAGGLVLVGCQDSLVNSSSETEHTSVPSTAGNGQGPNGLGQCDAVVDPGSSIQGTIDDQSTNSGDVVCVKPGTYEEIVAITKSVTVRGQTPATSGNPVVVKGWVSIEAGGSTLRRVLVTRDNPTSLSVDPFGIRITASDVLVAENVIEEISESVSGSINGIQAFGEEPLSNIAIRDNIVRDYRNVDENGDWVFGGVAGIKVQADVSDVEVTGNEVRDLHSGFGFGVVLTTSGSADGVPKNVLIEGNTLEGINDGSVFDVFGEPETSFFPAEEGRDGFPFPGSAVGIDGNAKANEATLRSNNLLAPNGAESKDGNNTLIAECNWWGDKSGPTDDGNPDGEGTWALERGNAEIEYTPWLNASAPSNACVGGETPGNGGGPGNGQGVPGQ